MSPLIFKNYEYRGNENVVLISSTRRRRDPDEPTGIPESLRDHMGGTRMGDRALRVRPREVEEKLAKLRRKKARRAQHGRSSLSSAAAAQAGGASATAAGKLSSAPAGSARSRAFDQLLALLAPLFPPVSHDVLISAADEVVAVFHDEEIAPAARPALLADIVGSAMPGETLTTIEGLVSRHMPAPKPAPVGPQAPAAMDLAVVAQDDDDEYSDDGGYSYSYSYSDDGGAGGAGESGGSGLAPMAVVDGTPQMPAPVAGGTLTYSMDPTAITRGSLLRDVAEAMDKHPDAVAATVDHVLDILSDSISSREAENRLSQAIGRSPGAVALTRKLVSNARLVTHVIALCDADSTAARQEVLKAMVAAPDLAPAYPLLAKANPDFVLEGGEAAAAAAAAAAAPAAGGRQPRRLDLASLAQAPPSSQVHGTSTTLPATVKRIQSRYSEEIIIPAPAPPQVDANALVPIASLPEWVRPCFPGMTSLNRIQSKVYPTAFNNESPAGGNLLICAPTGAGKTNIAVLTILNTIAKYRNPATGVIDTSAFKVVVTSPMKSLVAEQVQSFSARLAPLGITVAELSGDSSLAASQLAATSVIVATPEKLDVLSRKGRLLDMVRLLIIDEVHLLHDERGAVLEALVARTLRLAEETQNPTRLVGLSATLPNYRDVAHFLRVDASSGLFYFDATYRPCPLQLSLVGISAKKPHQRLKLENEIVYTKVADQVSAGHQVLVFVHARKGTLATAQDILDRAEDAGLLPTFVPPDSASRVILADEAEACSSPALASLLRAGVGVHHAGMPREHRSLVENLFAGGHLRALVATATLAWGVNLPAHAVIIKGTSVYSAAAGAFVPLSGLDIIQMLGRAGRPAYDTFGEGVVITTHPELSHYVSLLSSQLPIESQLLRRLPDLLNAELVLGSLTCRDDAVEWLGYTYLFVRLLQSMPNERESDASLEAYRTDLAHSALCELHDLGLVRYDARSGSVALTPLARIAAHFYVTPASVAAYASALHPQLSDLDLLRVFAGSAEFKYMPVRADERPELVKLLDKVPVPVKESADEPLAKVNVLLQAYISRLPLTGYALAADMVYIAQSAARLMRALFAIARTRKWARLSASLLELCAAVDRRQWRSFSPLRQLPGLVEPELVAKLERRDFEFERLYDLSPQELGELVRVPKAGKPLYKAVHSFPRLEVSGALQPLTRSLLKIDLVLTPDFRFARELHGNSLRFWLFVEDADGEALLHSEEIVLRADDAELEVSFTVPVFEPAAPQYFVRVMADRYLGASTVLPIALAGLVLPAKFEAPTEVLDLAPVATAALRVPAFVSMYEARGIHSLTPLQSQVFPTAWDTDASFLFAAPPGAGATTVGELVILRALVTAPAGAPAQVAVVVPHASALDALYREWSATLGGSLGRVVSKLSGEVTSDLKKLASSDVTLGTPAAFEGISRRWRSRKAVSSLRVVIFDDVHCLGDPDVGPTMEVLGSRLRYMAAELNSGLRFVALGASAADASDIGSWLGMDRERVFNFAMSAAARTLRVTAFDERASSKLVYKASAGEAATGTQSLVFVPGVRQARLLALELVALASAREGGYAPDEAALAGPAGEVRSKLLAAGGVEEEPGLVVALSAGVGFMHPGMAASARAVVDELYARRLVSCVVVVGEQVTALPRRMMAGLVVVAGTGSYGVTSVLKMVGRSTGAAHVLTTAAKHSYYAHFLTHALPVESALADAFASPLVAELAVGSLATKADAVDWLTWTLLYKRVALNPNYYDVASATPGDISIFLSDTVENAVEEAVESRAVSVGDDGLSLVLANPGAIASFYNLSLRTVGLFTAAARSDLALVPLVSVLCGAEEVVAAVKSRRGEGKALGALWEALPAKAKAAGMPRLETAHGKAVALVLAHFSRQALPPQLANEQRAVVAAARRCVSALVDAMASAGFLAPTLAAMDIAKSLAMAVWADDSELLQLPHVDDAVVVRLSNAGVASVDDLMEMDDDDRLKALQLEGERLGELAAAANALPALDLKAEASGPHEVVVVLERDEEDDDDDEAGDDGPVIAPFFPGTILRAGWWVVVGDASGKAVLGIKKTTAVGKPVRVPVAASAASTASVFAVSDVYMGVDLEVQIAVQPAAAVVTSAGDGDDEYEYESYEDDE
ncbi:U5 small nuclear ribonucleoprotein helicase [Thecamonas trahens ATCC 50062]|uniref:U5 small nuclear ribonucleoprotein helicase n=1 Tax=Thecamonas trahens ATCC 50062 TaxID=461836 RepID=A0A0L0DSN4_THETB|nr:U5 small nuclear ribonucleoprotein helicase [Thecamonas trahens ATCC 50062]KNC55280.1 U5 small nuclear ribonucleoprotein helicase [Thecamonas trahens ATCC 50062]|eukprot:XP_013753102.1 U5 small nuclear ribonucleoprotein helicase [Thecamonas trahens ATCC 50062]